MSKRDAARAWEQKIVIPTYGVGTPGRNPMFLEKRVYQGSRGAVYPHPVIDRVSDEKRDEMWTAVFLANRWLKIMILPELGGRVQMAVDKTNGYPFVYYNRVIKPALVGLAGPWISGGIEFNWPQHHRPSTYEPVEYRIARHPDGSATVWCSEIERMYRTRALAGFTLHPDRAVLDISVRLQNRTDEPQTFLWWANPAVHVNDNYQSVFPPDVHAVMDHGKRDVSAFPIAKGTYYKVDYAPGTDISRYRNIPVPTSYMAYHSDFDFVGCYDHGKRAGMMHVADHHHVPGKKQWTWGHGDFGRAWDRQLTDEDGPYIELMCGAFTDNQPDFSWLMPGEEKSFTQTFFPYKLTGGATNANREAVVNLGFEGRRARVGVYLTGPGRATVELLHKGRALLRKSVSLSPETAFTAEVRLPSGFRKTDVTLRVRDGLRTVIESTPLPDAKPAIPSPATAAKPPADIASNEELFLNGLHLEQYRHATWAPEPYYQEALRRDPLDSRCNNAMGLLLYRRGAFTAAEPYFRNAVRRLTSRNPNPYDGEPHYNLGLCLTLQGRHTEAADAFFKATWNEAWKAPAYFELARLASRRGAFEEALSLVGQSLDRNARDARARHLRTALLRRMGRADEARREVRGILGDDPLEAGALNEKRLLGGPDDFSRHLKNNAHARIEIALDYAHAGLFDEAAVLLREAVRPPSAGAPRSPERSACPAYPMALYYLGWVRWGRGDAKGARRACLEASKLPPDYVFPNEIECVPVLELAQRLNPKDARAPYYLGNFLYAHRRPDEAVAAWERAARLDPAFPTVHRNLALAAFNHQRNPDLAWRRLQRAFRLDPTDARVLFELDQLARKRNEAPARRLARLLRHRPLAEERDDLCIEFVTLLNLAGRHDDALSILTTRTFHPWEGGEGKTSGQYVQSLLGLARLDLAANRFAEAAVKIERAFVYPPNLGEGKLPGARENHLYYVLGVARAGLGDRRGVREAWRAAAVGLSEPLSAMYYNDQPPDMMFYQGLAMRALGREAQARAIFRTLADYGRRHLGDDVKMDYFAVSLPDFLVFEDDLNLRNRIHCRYMAGLGKLGLGDMAGAQREFDAALAEDAAHQGTTVHRRFNGGE